MNLSIKCPKKVNYMESNVRGENTCGANTVCQTELSERRHRARLSRDRSPIWG